MPGLPQWSRTMGISGQLLHKLDHGVHLGVVDGDLEVQAELAQQADYRR